MKSWRRVDVMMLITGGRANGFGRKFPSMPLKPHLLGFGLAIRDQLISLSKFSGSNAGATSVGLFKQNHTGDLAE
jgi:hypothetical protein